MDKLKKFFPLMPKKDDIKNFILSLLFYQVAVPMIVSSVTAMLIYSFIFMGISTPLAYVGSAYAFVGTVFSILHFAGVIE